jgi:hypothetical protein
MTNTSRTSHFSSIVVALAISFSAVVANGNERIDLSSNKIEQGIILGFQSDNMLPFACHVPKSDGVFQWTPLALIIQKIECDGKLLSPFMRGANVYRFDAGVIDPKACTITYMSNFSPLLSIRKYDLKTQDFEADIYTIPKEFSRLVIFYMFRFPNGKNSKQKKLIIEK